MRHFRSTGRVDYLRVHSSGGYGPADDHLTEEVVAGLDSQTQHRFGIPLKDGPQLAANQAMFQLLLEGLVHDVETSVEYEIEDEKRDDGSDRRNGSAFRVELRRRP